MTYTVSSGTLNSTIPYHTIQQQFWMKECDILRQGVGSKHTLTPPTYFQGVNILERPRFLCPGYYNNNYYCRFFLRNWPISPGYLFRLDWSAEGLTKNLWGLLPILWAHDLFFLHAIRANSYQPTDKCQSTGGCVWPSFCHIWCEGFLCSDKTHYALLFVYFERFVNIEILYRSLMSNMLANVVRSSCPKIRMPVGHGLELH